MRNIVLALPFIATAAAAQNVPQVDLVPWAMGLDTITDITYSHTDDDRLFVVMKQGMVRIVSDSMVVDERPFLDISDRVLTAGHEQGLLGLAFDPDYANNGQFYVNYISGTGAGVTTISRWTVSNDPDSADMASEELIYSYPQPYMNHNGGDLAFGSDSLLYIPLGDGGDAGDPQGHAQNLSDPLGDILRIDVRSTDQPYTIPASNPWATGVDTMPEIWASGLRNPFRLSFDRETGDLWFGDVGQSAWEEVDYVAAGANGGHNFGWRCYEGPAEFNILDCAEAGGYMQPVAAHINDGNFGDWCSVIGGYVYRGTRFPHFYGRYIYTDYCKSQFWSLRPEGDGTFVDEMVRDATTNMAWTTFGENAAGELFVGNELPGNVYMLVDRCPMDAPVISYNDVTLSSTFADSSYTWFLDNIVIPGATESTWVPTEDGDYFVQAAFMGGCVLNSDTISVIITGVNEFSLPTLNVQPNPALSMVTISWSMDALVGKLCLVNAQGRIVRTTTAPTSRVQLDVNDLPAGAYAVQLFSRDGAILTTRNLLVVH